jgi:hypothetical protein
MASDLSAVVTVSASPSVARTLDESPEGSIRLLLSFCQLREGFQSLPKKFANSSQLSFGPFLGAIHAGFGAIHAGFSPIHTDFRLCLTLQYELHRAFNIHTPTISQSP